MDGPHLVRGVELARILAVTPETIRKWRRHHIIPYIQINRITIRYDVPEVITALKQEGPCSADPACSQPEDTSLPSERQARTVSRAAHRSRTGSPQEQDGTVASLGGDHQG